MALPDCIEWARARDDHGYGNVNVKGKFWKAHRLAWTEVNGPIPDGLYVLHHCDNPPCCNVEHLFLGTQADNMADAAAKGRIRSGNTNKPKCKRGHLYTEENTLVYNGARYCRACRRMREHQGVLEGRR